MESAGSDGLFFCFFITVKYKMNYRILADINRTY